jgi:flagella basal body P-ring formation protein FlgA
MMTRAAFVAALLALLAPVALAPTASGEALRADLRTTPALKRAIVVTEEFVRIGDLIEHAGALADVPVFRAPDLGMTGSISTAKVLDAIRPHHLFRVDVADIADVEVTRSGRSVLPAEIEARILRAFAGHHGLGEAHDLTLAFDREPRAFSVEPTANAELQVARAQYEPRSGRFDITLELPDSQASRRAPLRFSGTLLERVEVMTLTRSLQTGEIVRAGDIVSERRPRREASADAVAATDAVIGLSARRPLRAGQPLRRGDLVKPDLVKRDDAVILVYEAPGMMLTTRGKAIEAGAEGDLVSAVNVQSKRTVQGVVSGPGRITLVATTPRVLAAAAPNEKAARAKSAPARGE